MPFKARAMFPAVLDLARASACKDIVALINREAYAAALALAEKTVAGPFLWRGALTNGDQQGFCLYALHGLQALNIELRIGTRALRNGTVEVQRRSSSLCLTVW